MSAQNNVLDVIKQLSTQGVELTLDGDKLKARSQKGNLTPPIVALIKQHKADLLAHLKAASHAATTAQRLPLEAVPRDGSTIPLSYAQQRLWFVDRLSGGSAHYNIPSALRLSGAFDVVSAEQALQRIVARHEPLRTVFRESGEGAEQVIREQVEFTLRRTDLRERPAAEQTAAVQAAVDADALTAFDLERDVLLRAHFLDLGVDDGVLLFTMHHIVSDGWSMGVLVDEFITQYQAVQAGEPDPLPPLTIQYADFAHWQRQYLQGELRDQQLDFWRTTLADLPPVHSLPLDRPRPAEPGHTGGHANVTVAPATTAALKQLAQAHNATVFMVLHAAATLWLSRHSHSRDIVLGTPVANRLDAQLQPLVGFFVNSLVLRTQVPDSDSRFSDYLAQVRNVNLDAQAHQDIPFELLVDDLKPERTPQYAPLFQIMFSMNTNTASGRSLPGLTLSPLASDAITAKFDLIIAVEEHDDEALTVTLEYNCDLWHAATVEAMAARYGTLLQGLAANPNSRLSDLPLLTDSEHQWLQQHNATHSDYPRDTDLTALVAARAAQHPQRIAARYGDASLTYAALDQRANGVAHHLVDHGVRPGDHVGLYVERSLDMLVGMLGILKAGGAYVPLDTTYPADRLAYMVQDAGVHCVLTQSHLPPLASVNPVALDQWQRSADHPPAVTIAPTDRAYVIYTSGSTGQPKGVAVTHRNVVRLVHPGSAARNDYPVVETDIVAQASNHAFDAATFEVWGALTQGAQLVGISKDDLLDPVTLRQQLRDQHVSVLFVTTALFNQIAQAAPDSFAHVRVLRFGGEAVDNQWVRTILQQGRPAHLLHVYGPTENTTFSTAYEVTEAETASYPIGFPLAQSSVHVLDPWQQPVPQGSEGELYVGGDGVADGYWQRPELNAERFVRDPFSPDPGARLYRTGDLVRMRADGALVFVGRVDHQIKLRGFRIELGEIEQALLAQPGIRSAIVILREDSPGQKALCAYVVSDEHPSLDAATADALRTRLRDALQQDLPDYMVPAAIEPLAALPLTANGKIDRNALPVPTLSESAGADYQPPANAIEHQLVNLWAELLGRDPATLSVNANFFELGGDSILSIQLVSRALQQGLQLSVKQLFAHQTIRRLAPCVTQGQGIAIPQGPVTGAMPLLPIQRRFLQEAGDRQHFNQAVLLRVPADLDSAALQAVVHHWYQRHDALRLRFVQDADHHWSAEHQPLDDAMLAASWEQVDYRDADSVSRNAQTQQRAMNIHTGPLFKAIHYRPDDGAPDGYRLLLVAHHLIVDGVSWRILLDDAQQWLGQASRGQPLRPAAKTSAYQQWGEWLQDYVHSDAFQSQKAYWHQQISRLASADAQRLHAEQPRCQHGDAGHITLDWSVEHTRALLSQAGRAYRTQVNELLLSGLLLGLSRWSGCTQVLIDLEGHGRESRDERIDLTQTVGWFTSVYPLALSLPDGDNDDLGRLIQQVKQQYRAVPDHGIGYGLLRYLADDPVLADGPQAPVVFNYLGQFDQVVNDDGPFAGAPESRGDDVSPERAMSHALNFNGLVADGCLSFDLSYDPQQYSAETMAALADAVQHSVTALIQHCLDPESGAVSAADFPLVAMDDAVVRDWPHQLNCRPRDVEDLYPATPMQSGLLFHSLLVRSAYVTQLRLTFEGDLDTQAFRQAWHTLQQRHAIFRTAFVGEDHGQLHQAVLANAPVPWHSDNLRHLSAEAQNAHIEAYRDAEYEAGFNLHAAPLMAVALFQTLSAAGEPQTQLLWSHHHALSDGWCLGLIFSELQSAYRAALHGQAPALPPVTPYREYIAWWQRQDMAAARTYWQQVLADIDGPTPLPGGRVSVDDHAAPAVQHHLQLSAAASDRLSALARSTQTTVNTLLQAAWSYLLARYSGDDTVVFGTTVSGRPADLPGVESMVGLFINTLPVVVTVPNDSPIETWLQTLHQQQHARNTYSYIPLADLQRERGISPLFDSLLVFENYPVDRLREQRDEVDPAALRVVGSASVEATNYPLSITASLSDCLHVKLTYQPAQLSQAQVERLGQQLLRVLQQLDSATHVGELSLLSAAETQQALTALQGPRVAYPDTCLHTQFEAQVTRTPDAIAVVADDGELSYAQLNAQANQVARALRARGVSTQTLVGLCATRSSAMLVGLIGILKAGAAYVPIDPNYPPARQTHLLEDSGVNWVVTAGVSELASTEHQCQTLALDSDHIQAELLTLDNDNLNLSDINPRALAYVIYTSGSTGKPKGVMVEHRSIINLACWMNALANEQFGHHAQNWALNAPVAFDSSLKVVTQLGFGRTLYLLNADIRLDPDALLTYLTENSIDVVDMTPSLTEIVLTCAESRACRLPHILIGGEAINQRLWHQLVKVGNQIDRRFINVYGPTEATVDTTYAVINESQTSTIGLPIDNMVVHLLDSSRRSVPVGCAGEMYIEGTGLARGYLNRAMNTEESFVKVSIAGHDRRLYKTGDKARLTEKGTLEFIGRTDNQLKIRGFRVELDEINQHVSDHPSVVTSFSCAQHGKNTGTQIVTYVTLASGPEDDATQVAQIREELLSLLPDFMVPAFIVPLDKLPLNENGKIDRSRLPIPAETMGDGDAVKPTNKLESQLLSIWSELLELDENSISVTQNIFSLGAHSLLMLKVLAKMKQQGIDASLKQLYEKPSIRDFARTLKQPDTQNHGRCIIRLNQCTQGSPLFIFHPYGGRCDGYLGLAKALEKVCPVYGVQAPFNDSQVVRFEQFSELAEFYIHEMRAYQPSGPYNIAGWSAGGNIAAMVANRLVRHKDEVQRLFIIDALLQRTNKAEQTDEQHLMDVLKIELQDEESPETSFVLPSDIQSAINGKPMTEQITLVAGYLANLTGVDNPMSAEQISVGLQFGIDFNKVDRSVPEFSIGGKSMLITASKNPSQLKRDIFEDWLNTVHASENQHCEVSAEHHLMMRGEAAAEIGGLIKKEMQRNRKWVSA